MINKGIGKGFRDLMNWDDSGSCRHEPWRKQRV